MNRAALESAFAENFTDRGEVGASLSIWDGNGEVISLHDGVADRTGEKPWTGETIVPVWSATKGPGAVVVLKLLVDARLDLDTPITEIWPALPTTASVGQVLSHQAGFAALDERVPITDRDGVLAALEAQTPQWSLGDGHGYHPRTFGFLLDGIAMRLDPAGRTVGEIWNANIASPLGLEFWIGLPETEFDRVAELRPARVGKSAPPNAPATPDQRDFYRAFGDPDSLTRAAFVSPFGFNAVADFNELEAWVGGWPAMGGIGTASGLAKFYAILANRGVWQGEQVFPEIVTEWAEATLTSGEDKVLRVPTAFSAGFMRPPSLSVGVQMRRAFGHPGAGGSHVFADPERGIGFAYTMNQMEQSVLPNLKSIALIDAFLQK